MIKRKMLRSIKQFGRCPLCQGNHSGHGNCVVTRDIQSVAINRTQEKRQFNKEIEDQINDSAGDYDE